MKRYFLFIFVSLFIIQAMPVSIQAQLKKPTPAIKATQTKKPKSTNGIKTSGAKGSIKSPRTVVAKGKRNESSIVAEPYKAPAREEKPYVPYVADAKGGDVWNSNGNFYYRGEYYNITPVTTSNHKYLKDCYATNSNWKNGTLTMNGKGVVLRTDGGATWTPIPQTLADKINEIYNKWTLKDVHVTENGKFVLIWGDNGWQVSSGPQALSDKLREFHDASETLYSACCNDNGSWAVVSNKHFSGDNATQTFMQKASNLYGTIYSVSLSEKGKIACCAKGVYFEGIPSNLSEALGTLNFKPKYIKFTDNGLYMIFDGITQVRYFM